MVPLLLLLFITQGAGHPSYQHFDTQSMLVSNDNISYVEQDNCIHVLHDGKLLGILAKRHEGVSRSSQDILNTILLPDSMGGVVSPNRFAYNSIDDKIYIIGTDMRNIAVCDAQTGERLGAILTGVETMDLACSETNNKLYCSVYRDSTLLIIDGAGDSVIKTIPLQDYPMFLVSSSTTNEIYCAFENLEEITVIDCVDDSISATISVGGTVEPWNMLFNPATDKIYCACHCAPWIDSLFVIDVNTYSVIAAIPIDMGNYRLALNSVNSKVYCVSEGDDNAAVIDGLGDSLITTIDLGNRPECVAYNSVMNRFYVGHLASSDIYVVDGNTDQVLTTVYAGGPLWAMAFDSLDNRIFVASTQDPVIYGNVIVLDCSTNTIIDRLPVGVWPRGIFWEKIHNQVWVGNTGASDFPTYTIDLFSADSLEHRFETLIGYTPYASTINMASNKLYSVGHCDTYLMSLDLNDPGSPAFLNADDGPWDVLYNPLVNKIYSANRWNNTVSVIDGLTDSIIARVPTDSEPVVLALNQTDNKIYVGNLLAASLTVIDGSADSVLSTVPVGNYPIPVLWNPTGNKVYCGNADDNTVTIIDADVDTVLATIPVGDTPYKLEYNPTNNKIYCANFFSDDMTIINGTTDEVITTLHTGNTARPYTFAYNATNNKIYCANILGGSVSVIDGVADSIVKTIPVPGGPFSLVYNHIANKLFCAYVDRPFPKQQSLAVIDGASDSIMTAFSLDASVWYFGIGSPQKALVFDSLRNIVYYGHYQASKISVIDGETGVHEAVPATTPTGYVFRILPNPAQGSVRILYSLRGATDVRLAIYDISGRCVKNFENLPGRQSVVNQIIWDGMDDMGLKVPAGVYFLELRGCDYKKTKKVVLLK